MVWYDIHGPCWLQNKEFGYIMTPLHVLIVWYSIIIMEYVRDALGYKTMINTNEKNEWYLEVLSQAVAIKKQGMHPTFSELRKHML